MKKYTVMMIILSLILIVGCASIPKRAEYKPLPPLENGWGRLYFFDANKTERRLRPIIINEKDVGSIGEDEHIVVDLLPGTYEIYCSSPRERTFFNRYKVDINGGETIYYSCQVEFTAKGMIVGGLGTAIVGPLGGALGAALAASVGTKVSEKYVQYDTDTCLYLKPFSNKDSVLVSYKKFDYSSQENKIKGTK